MPISAVDLFCGVGGLTHGLQLSGIPVVAGLDVEHSCQYAYEQNNNARVGLQYILDSGKKKDEGFARIGYCEFRKNNKDRKEVQIPHDNCNTGHEVQAIPNVLREEIWRSTSVAEI